MPASHPPEPPSHAELVPLARREARPLSPEQVRFAELLGRLLAARWNPGTIPGAEPIAFTGHPGGRSRSASPLLL